MKKTLTRTLIGLACLAGVSLAHAQSTAFTYQGRLNDGAGAATGSYDLTFALFDAANSGVQQGLILTNSSTAVSNGLFTVSLDFGNQFPGANRWLEIGVRTNGNGLFATLSPRQPLAATPYAIQAARANAVAAANITGSMALGQLPGGLVTNGSSGVSFSGTFAGNGAGMTNVDLMGVVDHGAIGWKTNDTAFTLAASVGVGANLDPYSVIAADVNGDGHIDLVSGNKSSLTVLTNDGSGGFAVSSSPYFPSILMARGTAADVNGDGMVDLIVADFQQFGSQLAQVMTNDGRGGFSLSSAPDVGFGGHSVTAADVNGDGKVDLISANMLFQMLTVLTNDGRGGFAVSSSPGVGSRPQSVMAADVNGDGKVDLITANYDVSTLTVLTNDGSGGFAVSSSPGVGRHPHSVTAVDVNGDGHVDLITANEGENTLTILTNNGSGGFSVSSSPGIGFYPQSVTAADVNGDGHVDLISANYGDSTLTVLTNNGSGGFALWFSPGVGDSPFYVTAADVNGDGHVDLITANPGGDTLTLFLYTAKKDYGGIFRGDGSGLTSLNATNVTGVLGTAQIPNLDAAKIDSGTFGAAQIPNLDAAKITGILGVAQIPSLDASKISSGTLGDARLSPNVALLSANQTFTGANVISNSAGQPDLLFRGNSILRLLAFNNGNYIQSGATNAAGSTNDLYFTGIFGAPVQMVVKANGSVGIGNGTPAAKLDVSGSGWFRDDSGGFPASAGSGVRVFNQTSGGGGQIFAYNYQSGSPIDLILQASGGRVGIGTQSPTNKLHVAGGVSATAFVATSDRNAKENFAPVSAQEILEKVAALPITTWNFKAMGDGRHIGPMAQDFHAAFGLGGSDTTITSVDPDGVALAAIQGLNEKVEGNSQKAEASLQRAEVSLQTLKAENAELKARLERLERLLTRLPEGGAR